MKKDLEIIKTLIREMNEELKGGQKKLDVAEPFGKITGADFKALRAKKGMDEADYPTEKWAELGSIYNQGKAAGWEAGYNQGWNDCENGKEKRPNIALKETEDHEVSMANNSIDSIIWAATELKKHLQGGERDIPAWIQDHITNAENYILQAAKNYHEYGAEEQPEMPDEMSLQEMIKKVGSKYNVYSKKGKKLGSHPSKKKAKKQMAAIEISKQGK